MYKVGSYLIRVLEKKHFLDPFEYIEGTLYCNGREYIFDGYDYIGSGSVCNRQRLMEFLKDAEQVNKFLHA